MAFYVTGDTHRDFERIEAFCKRFKTTKEDAIVILGDVGINYFLDQRDEKLKEKLETLPITLLCVRGNHEARPGIGWQKADLKTKFVCDETIIGPFMFEERFPSILYMLDGEHYVFMDKDAKKTVLVIGGAYSVDKDFRLEQYDLGNHNYRWFKDEQLSDAEQDLVLKRNKLMHFDYVFTHTCPLEYEPHDMFLNGIDQSTVDKSMEKFLSTVSKSIFYDKWYCGHWHTDRTVDKLRFMFNDIIMLQ